MTQIIRNPCFWSIGMGNFPIMSSDKLEYWIATPRDGWEVESFHGGSIMITSNSLLATYNCLVISLSKSSLVTSAQMGTAF